MSTGHPEQRWLIADIGGTHARFAMIERAGASPSQQRVLACNRYPTLEDAIEAYLARTEGPRPRQAAVAVATPITGDFLRMTNLDWSFSIESTRQALGFNQLRVINDFAAQALAVPHLEATALAPLGGRTGVPGTPLAVLGPGTGLGVSGLIPAENRWIPIQGEGGHMTASPATEREVAVVQTLRKRFDHVSAERLVSGAGLANLYYALTVLNDNPPEALEAPEIVRRARAGTCAVCTEAIHLFSGLLGNIAGNLVLTLGAQGGFYLCGGLIARLGTLFDREYFRQRFEAHGRLSSYLAEVPGYEVLTEHPALIGLARGYAPHLSATGGSESPSAQRA